MRGSRGHHGIVVAVDAEELARPVVRVLADRDGRSRMSERHFPSEGPPRFVGDRDYFIAAKDGTPDTIHVGRLVPGRSSGRLAFRVARGVLRNDADAEDVAQEALLRAYRRFRMYAVEAANAIGPAAHSRCRREQQRAP